MEIYKNLSLEDLPNEEWRDVVGYEGLYQVSNMGRVKSLERKSAPYFYKGKTMCYAVHERICKQPLVMGYLMVHLSKNNVKEQLKVHRIVATAFIPNPDGYPQVNHINEDKLDNRTSNLEWCTSKYNNNHGTRNQRISIAQRNNPEYSKPIQQYTLQGEFVREWASICEAGRNGYDRKAISNMCNKEEGCHTANGYLWKFSNDDTIIKPYVNPTFKQIFCYDKNGMFIKEFPSIKSACEELGLDSGAVCWCCMGKRKSHRGYTFKYKQI